MSDLLNFSQMLNMQALSPVFLKPWVAKAMWVGCEGL